MTKRIKILFVCFPDSTHSQSWIKLLESYDLSVRIFSFPLRTVVANPPVWSVPTYITVQPDRRKSFKAQIFWLLPRIKGLSSVIHSVEDSLSLNKHYLKWVIRNWKPDILHSFSFDTGTKLALSALAELPEKKRPKWVVSAWGHDIVMGLFNDKKNYIKKVLKECDGFFADCKRDLGLAIEAGLAPYKLAFNDAVPGAGGIDIDYFQKLREKNRNSNRNLIVIPKAFEREHANKTLPILEALKLIQDGLQSFEIHLVMCSETVSYFVAQLPEALRKKCHCHGQLSQAELFDLFVKARVIISPSLMDGTPNSMLEAMAAGALPIMAALESIQEWIKDGINGLLVHPLYPDQIAYAIKKAIIDDELFKKASQINYNIIKKNANRYIIKENIYRYYQRLIC